MEKSKAMEYGRRKASSDVLTPRYIYIYIYRKKTRKERKLTPIRLLVKGLAMRGDSVQ
jgi:hypothetical protein